MKDFIKKEEPEFEREDAHVLNDDTPDGDLPELPQIVARKRKMRTKRGKGRTTKKKTKKTKTGTRKKKRTTKKKRKTASGTTSSGGKIGRIRRGPREKEPKLHIRQNDDVVVLDEEDLTDTKPILPPPPPKPTPPNILDQIMIGQEKEFGVVKPGATPKSRIPPYGRRSVWNK